MTNTFTLTEEQQRGIVEEATNKALSSFVSHLDNYTPEKHEPPLSDQKEDYDMARSRQKFKITLPDGTSTWATGDTVSDAFLNFASKFSEPNRPREPKALMTVKEFVDNIYFPTYILGLAPTTVENYTQYLSLNIFPFLGDMPIDSVTVADIQNFYNWMANASEYGRKKNINEASIRRISALTERIFKVALDMDIITKLPFKKSLLTIKAERAGHHKALTDDEIDRVKREIPLLEDDDQRAYMGFLAYTDMRREEILGVHWEDINLDKQFCSVEWTVTYPDNSKPVVRHETKTESSERLSLLPTPLVQILKPLQKSSGFVFGGENAWCYSKASRTFNRARKVLGIEKYDNHDFRTTQCTQRSELGMDNKANADLMGHSDTRMVETVYARRRKEGILKHLEAVEAMNAKYTKLTQKLTDTSDSKAI